MSEPSPATAGALAGLRVVVLGDGLAPSVVGMMLAEQGAETVRVRDRARSAVDPVLAAMVTRGCLEATLVLDGEGREVLAGLIRAADVLVEDLPAGRLAALGIDPDAIRAGGNPGLVNVSLTRFSPADPRAAQPPHEALVGMAGFLYEKPLGPPRYHELPIGSLLAALFAACGVLAALVARERLGRGQRVETSLYHANLFAQILLVLTKTGVPRGFLPLKMIGTPFMGSWLCKDGRYIYLHITLPAHNARILERLEEHGYADEVRRLRAVLSPTTQRDPSQVKSIAEAKKLRRLYERIFLTRNADEWEALLGGELCCIKVRTIDEWVRDSIAAGMSDACEVMDPVLGPLLAPGPAVSSEELPPRLAARVVDPAAFAALRERWEATPPPAERPARVAALAHPLEGIRVLDLSRVIAGPCAARVLAELGADVLSLQSPTGLDWALSFHLLFNAGKRSATLDSTSDEGKRKLLAIADAFDPHALVQNYRHLDISRAIGVDPEAMRARFPALVYTHLNAYGNQGVWRDRPGFEQVVQAVSGIQVTYGRGERPRLLPTPVIDIGSGLLGAFATLLGLYHRERTGEGLFATTHLTRMAVLFQLEFIAASQRERCLAHAAGRVRFEPGKVVAAGIVKARDGRACVAGPRDELARWLASLGGGGDGAEPIALAARLLRRRSVAEWQRELQAQGLADQIGLVAAPRIRRLCDEIRAVDGEPPLVRKRDYPGCPVPLTFVGNPIRMVLTPLVEPAPPPLRGQDTREVLALIGESVPEGAGVIPYPKNKPLLLWLLTVLRWGYFAWRSGNI
jgi:crotonobetainyl-CoA:carnitine CoA-transferase CaiB-like acyl-CoA transferase